MCMFLDPSKILLCSVLGWYSESSEVLSKKICGASFWVGQGQGSAIKLEDLDLYPGTCTLRRLSQLSVNWGAITEKVGSEPAFFFHNVALMRERRSARR